MLLQHIGFEGFGTKLHKALDVCGQYERAVVMTSRDTGSSSQDFGDYLMRTVADPSLESRWGEYVKA